MLNWTFFCFLPLLSFSPGNFVNVNLAHPPQRLGAWQLPFSDLLQFFLGVSKIQCAARLLFMDSPCHCLLIADIAHMPCNTFKLSLSAAFLFLGPSNVGRAAPVFPEVDSFMCRQACMSWSS